MHHPRNVYLRERDLVPALDEWIAAEFSSGKLARTLDALAGAQQEQQTSHTREIARLHESIAECDRKLAQHRAALEAGADPTLVTEWMKETQAQRSAAKVKLDRTGQTSDRMSKDDIMNVVEALGNIADVLRRADPRDKAEVYKGLGLRLRYQPAHNTVRAEVNLDPYQGLNHPYGEMVRVRGGTRTISPRDPSPLVLSADLSLNGR